MPAPRSWDIFCRVIDNYGDAAVCWRLAQQLAAEGHGRVRLWIDHLDVLHELVAGIWEGRSRQYHAGVEICHWVPDSEFGPPAQVAVDAFGVGLPEQYAMSMAACSPGPIWIVLEYLSAEQWVASCHGLPSPHPRLPIRRYFFFPGFATGTGGLLREKELAARREDFSHHPQALQTLWRDTGFPPPRQNARLVSLFGYENPVVAELLDAWASGGQEVVAAVPPSRLSDEVASKLRTARRTSKDLEGKAVRRGALEVRFLPFVAQDDYDKLLWSADWNFVRGEDSFVRAQWAERPFVWQPYKQSAGAHQAKLEAFLEAYCSGLAPALAGPLRSLWRGWNGSELAAAGSVCGGWAVLCEHEADLRRHARKWAEEAAQAGDLANNLVRFCADRLK